MKHVFLLIAVTLCGRPKKWSEEKTLSRRKGPVEIPVDELLSKVPLPKNDLTDIIESYRLPTNEKGEPALVPIHYNVDLMTHGLKDVDRDEQGFFTFSGKMVVNVTCNKQSEYVVLHAGNASFISSVKLDGMEPTSWTKKLEKVKKMNNG